MSPVQQYIYDPKSLRYKDLSTGRFVSVKTVRSAVDAVIDTEAQKMRGISQKLVDGQINLAEWQVQMSKLLKELHVSMGLAANGGLANTSASDMGYIANQIKGQYKYLRDFALQIKRGEQKLDGTLVARSGQYAQSARGTYEKVLQRRAHAAGLDLEKSILSDSQHCAGCLEAADAGWSPIGSLAPIGERNCRGNCRCYFIYKKAPVSEEEADEQEDMEE